MKLKNLYNSKLFYLWVAFSFVYILFVTFFHQYADVWWDATSYIGLAKYFVSNGHAGVFEPMKSILLPIFLAVFIKLGLGVVIFGKILIFLLSLVSISFVYLIAREFFDEKTSFIAGLITFVNPVFLVFSMRIYAEMFNVCLVLGAMYFMLIFYRSSKNWAAILGGICAGLAIMSKYPNGIISLLFNAYLIVHSVKKKSISSLILFNISIVVALIPLFLLGSHFGNGDYLYFYHASQDYFAQNLGHSYDLHTFPNIPKLFFENTDLIYFKSLFYLLNLLIPFIAIGAWKGLQRIDRLKMAYFIILPSVIFFIFFEIFYLKQERYIIIVFPLLSLLGAYGLSKFRFSIRMTVICMYVIAMLVFSGIFLYNSYHSEVGYREFFVNPPVNLNCSNVATSDPRSLLKYDQIEFPYEVYDQTWNIQQIAKKKPDCIFYFSCYENRSDQIKILSNYPYTLKYYNDNKRCTYAIFAS